MSLVVATKEGESARGELGNGVGLTAASRGRTMERENKGLQRQSSRLRRLGPPPVELRFRPNWPNIVSVLFSLLFVSSYMCLFFVFLLFFTVAFVSIYLLFSFYLLLSL
jgi:hypothetical protein